MSKPIPHQAARHIPGSSITAVLCLLAALTFTLPANAADGHASALHISAEELPTTRQIVIGLNKSTVVQLPNNVSDVLVSHSGVLQTIVHTPRKIYLIGMKVGQANAFFINEKGEQILTLEISVERDLQRISAMIHKYVPGSRVKLEAINDNIVLTGKVRTPTDSVTAAQLAERFVGTRDRVLNMLTVESKEQVLLKVTVAEVNREAIKRLGVDLNEVAYRAGQLSFTGVVTTAFPATAALAPTSPAGASIAAGWQSGENGIGAVLEALERSGLLRTLAEPNLTSISGETAKFLAGGEFPVPVSGDGEDITVSFKKFGIGLSFTPLVMSDGRISLKVATEVSELSNNGAVTLGNISIPALKIRSAKTTIELPSGGALVMAGLISESTRRNIDGVPGLRNLPVLGALFRSEDFIRSETELVILVTPYLVKPVAPGRLARPDDRQASLQDDDFTLATSSTAIEPAARQTDTARKERPGFGFIIE